MARALIAMALLGLVASASAACVAKTSDAQADNCVFETGNGVSVTRTFTITSADLKAAGGYYVFYVFDMGQSASTNSASWSAPTITLSGSTSVSLSSPYSTYATMVVISLPGTHSATFTTSAGVNDRTGMYHGPLPSATYSSGVPSGSPALAELAPTTSGTAATDSTAFSWLPTKAMTGRITFPSSMRRKSVEFTTTSNAGSTLSFSAFSNSGVVGASSGSNSVFTAEHVEALQWEDYQLSIGSGTLQNFLRDESKAPLISFTSLSFKFTDYPVLALNSAVSITSESSEYYMVMLSSSSWWSYTLSWTDDGTNGPFAAEYATNPQGGLSTTLGSFGDSSITIRNSNFVASSVPTAITGAKIVTDATPAAQTGIVLRIVGSGSTVTFRSGAQTNLPGECVSSKSCFVEEDDHPARGGYSSSNSDVERLATCVALPSATNPNWPTTRCVECFQDNQCNEGQYCHVDLGMCSDANSNWWMCDAESNQKAGRCMDRDPLDNVLGKKCSTDASSGKAYGGVSSVAAYSSGQLIVSEGIEFNSDDDYISGTGFCGQAAYYNASNSVSSGATSALAWTNTARTILWGGKCINHVCQECDETDSMAGFDCINGKWKKHIDVDGTIRTLTQNTSASGILAVGLFTAFGFIAVIGVIVQAHLYRKQARKEVEDAKKAAADEKALEDLRAAEAEQAKKDAEARAAEKDAEEEAGAGESKAPATVE